MTLSLFEVEIIKAVKNMIDADLQVHHAAGYLAQQAGMSESRLKKNFKLVVKTTLYAYLKQKRMELAAELLEQTGRSLEQISKQTGFRYYSNFTRAFKKRYGTTPALYRTKSK
jgi:AraC-like DNA-binding protein